MALNFEISKNRTASGFYTLKDTDVWSQSVVDQARATGLVDSFHWNFHTGKLMLNILAYDFDEAMMIADWITEEVLEPDEKIKYHFDLDYLWA